MKKVSISICVLLFTGVIASEANGNNNSLGNPSGRPTVADVSYGPHERNTLNFWKAEGEGPTPVLVHIHGGAWIRGEPMKHCARFPYLGRGVSVVSIRYRLANEETEDWVPAPLLDAARAVQFVRFKADEWGVDKKRLAVTGGSAGGCIALWLALHDDLADPENGDPILRESSKPVCAVGNLAQTFIDIKMVREFVGPKAAGHAMIWKTVGASSFEDAWNNYATYAPLYREYSAYNHLDKDDPPVFLMYRGDGDDIHSSLFGDRLLEKATGIGARVYLCAPGHNPPQPAPYKGESDFICRQLLKSEQD